MNDFFSYICTDLKIFLKDNLNSESEDIPQYVSPIFFYVQFSIIFFLKVTT